MENDEKKQQKKLKIEINKNIKTNEKQKITKKIKK